METNQIIIFSICLIAAFILFKVLKSILKILITIIIVLVGSYYIYNSLNNLDLVDGVSKGKIYDITANTEYTPAVCLYNTSSATINFGQEGTFGGTETAGGNSDGNGIGNFKYSVPTGYLALCTKNLGS